MSIEAMALVLHHSQARGAMKLVLIGIANHEGDGGAWPTVATLAKYAGCSDRQVQRAIRDLVSLGEIAVHAQEGGNARTNPRYRPNRYDVLVRCPEGCDRTSNHRTEGGRGDTHVTPRGDTGVAPGVTPTSPEPSLNHPPETSYGRDTASPTRADPRGDDLRLFMDVATYVWCDRLGMDEDDPRVRPALMAIYQEAVLSEDPRIPWPGRYLEAVVSNIGGGPTADDALKFHWLAKIDKRVQRKRPNPFG